MQHEKNLNGGYIGLVMILLGVAVMAFLFIKFELPLLQKSPTTTNTNPEPGNAIDNNLSPIDSAKEAKRIIEQDNLRTMQQLP